MNKRNLIHARGPVRQGAFGRVSDSSFVSREFKLNERPLVFPWIRNYPHCLVLVGSRNGVEPDFTIEIK